MGSSSISTIFRGGTGPTGPTGPTGQIGPTGIGSGFTGNTGATGLYINNVLSSENFSFFFKNDGTNFIVSGTRGPTGYTGTMFGENVGIGLTLYSSIAGYTLSVRGLTFIGNLSAEVTGNSILVTANDVYTGVVLSSGIQNDRVVYSKTPSTIESTRIQLGKTYSNFSFSNTEGITSGSLPVYSEINGNIVDVPAGSNDLILGLSLGSVYYIHTPLGLSGFTLNPSSYSDKELVSFTMFVEGSGFTQFPSNVYFEDSPYSSVFGCGLNIMNIMSYDKGQNWFATITDRGYGVNGCSEQETVGSCCYIGASGDRECKEYVTQDWCNTKTSGQFNSLTACDPTCGKTAICCSGKKCVSGVSKEECEYFNGKYYEGLACSSQSDSGDNFQRICYDVNQPSVCCCTGGTCIDSVTATICLQYYNGTPVLGKCCEIDCSTGQPISGACCVNGDCDVKTPSECSIENGLFYGAGTKCSDVTCCAASEQLGHCCFGANCLAEMTVDGCVRINGIWYATQTECSGSCNAGADPFGYCCYDVTCGESLRSDCIAGDYNWFSTSEQCNQGCPP